ncbi:MAG: tripartite tricarboxylate transporter substrate binding protein [Vallitalea sp.]|jgi:tripartite-type tricarboxylate transporter receptor subunit TctC|nr:tripartite tricarboxylate transporter substrate binding protein [Vallitalea sp.]
MKKILLLLLSMVLVLSVFGGCSKNEEKNSKDSTVESTNNEDSSKDSTVDYPKKELRIIVPAGAAGNMSVNTRIIGKYLEKELGKSVAIENRPGAGGIVGATEYLVEEANSDTIIVLPSLVHSVAPLYQKVKYEADDFIPIIGMTNAKSVVLSNHEKTGINSFEDLIEYGKKETVKFGSGGPGTSNYMVQAALYKMAGISALTVPHKSAGEGITNLLGGHVDVTLASATLAKEYILDGSLTPLFVLDNEAYTKYEGVEIPSINKLGYDLTFDSYVYFAARKGTDQKVIDYLYNKFEAVYQNEEFKKEVQKRSVVIVEDNGQEVEEHINKATEAAKKFYDLIEK